MVTGLTYLMTSLTVGLLVMIARGQQHKTRDRVDMARRCNRLVR